MTQTQQQDSVGAKLGEAVEMINRLTWRSMKVGVGAVTGAPAMLRFMRADPLGLGEAFWSFWGAALRDPLHLAQAPVSLMLDYLALSKRLSMQALGLTAEPLVEPEKGDRRFRDQAWEKHLAFGALKQSYLLTARWFLDTVRDVEGLEPATARKVEFYTQQLTDAMAPTNFLATNPEALRETARSGGLNLLRGFDNMLEDLARGGSAPGISMAEPDHFEVGVDLAATPGQVVFENELMQLIQYQPTTAEVARRPVLLVPPPMNKFYILDLRQENSLVRWLVSQGQTVLCVSWVNPDARHAQRSFDDYVVDGIEAALGAVERATGEREVNVLGYCYGGILLLGALAAHAVEGDDRVASATCLTTMVDFTDVGEIRVFLDNARFPQLARSIEEEGYLDGRALSNAFRMLRANELVWAYFVNNYLLGKEPAPFDLLFWNADATNMPAAMHTWFIRNMYLENRLRSPGGVEVKGVPVDLGAIQIPSFFVSTAADHIAPWRSCYPATQLLGGPVEFVLGEAGHIAGVVSPPGRSKYGYWSGACCPSDPDAWREAATYNEGSWWPAWSAWLEQRAGGQVPARRPGDGALAPIEPAPGRYVRVAVGA